MSTEQAPEANTHTDPVLEELLGRMEAAEELLAAVAEEVSLIPSGGPWFWEALNPDQTRELWEALDRFMTWLQNRILSNSERSEFWIPECWYRHPDAVEVLTSVMVAHQAAYHPKTRKASFLLTDWFLRALWPSLEALERTRSYTKCKEKKEHVERITTPRRLEESTPAFQEFVDARCQEQEHES